VWATRTSNPDSQADIIAWLASPATHGGAAVERVETHISIVFLAGAEAYKLKRAVAFDYLDFSTPSRRRHYCEEEVRVNRRTAPAIYKGVLPITRSESGALAFDGPGEPVDWVVHMARFDQSQLLDRLAASNALPLSMIDQLGRSIAAFHRRAGVRRDRGGARGMQRVIDGNALELHDAALAARTLDELRAQAHRLDERREHGFVRECHGDLHLGNIVLIGGEPTLFDAIEFNDDIACCDVLYDLAFLIMDLRHRGLAAQASTVFNAYFEESADYEGLPLLPLFLSCRAAVRAKISAASAPVQHDAARRIAMDRNARDYRAEAMRLLEHRPAIAIAIGGLSGSGKSTIAASLAPLVGAAPGAVVLRSDVIRKQLLGAGRFDRLGAAGYTADVSRRVYAELTARMRRVLDAGHSVIVDATFLHEHDRQSIEQAARDAGVILRGIWLDASESVQRARLAQRQKDPSDADAAVLSKQLREDPGAISWNRVDAENSPPVEELVTKFR
jgi:aminoglycoside phosphotransferase family enzyme/predicted kinase